MPSPYTVAAGEEGASEKTLVATVVDIVTFTGGIGDVEVLNEGSVGIYVTVDGAAPTVGSAAAVYVPPASVRVIEHQDPKDFAFSPLPAGVSADTVVKLISSGAPKYSVSEEKESPA